jgi:hypothetical protein
MKEESTVTTELKGMSNWREELMQKYDGIFGDRKLPMTQTCMCWGLEVQDGWRKLLEELCFKLHVLETHTGIRVRALQVKEKYGTLRFYISSDASGCDAKIAEAMHDIVQSVVSDAERESGQICEVCGEYASTRVDGWYSTLCTKHAFEDERTLSDYEAGTLSPEDKAKYDEHEARKDEFFKKLQKERKDVYDTEKITPDA